MAVLHRVAAGFVSVILVLAVAACQSASATEVTQAVNSSALSTSTGTPTPQQSGEVVWARVPYCGCLADSATANVASALKNAHLKVNLKQLSPSEGWLYFAATFDPDSATGEQVRAAMKAGGAEILEGTP